MQVAPGKRRRFVASSLVLSVLAGGLAAIGIVTASPAAAAVSPVVQRPAGAVTADGLPTVQIDGVVWSQAMNGNTVYVGGKFANARPAGAAAGTNQTPRANLLAFNVTTGNLITTFNPSLNNQVKKVAVSPDGTRLYVAGSFTTADGAARNRIAAYNTSTGQLISTFTPGLNSTVTSMAVTNTTVYVAGWFTTANGVSRTRLAAFNASNGALLSWAPTADQDINAMTLSPDKSQVIIGGRFANVNGSPAFGIGAIDATTGALMPFPINTIVRNSAETAGTYSLYSDSVAIYGTSYNFGTGNFEGTWTANPDGTVKWLDDCHGDTYNTFSMNKVVYNVGHAHHCENIGGFPDTNPRVHWPAMAFTEDATGTVNTNNQGGAGYGNFGGQPSPSIINWFPTMQVGTYTGQVQAAWSLTGNGTYLVAGGEFPRVNNVPQQGIVRFAVPSASTNKRGPQLSGATFDPSVAPLGGNLVRLGWTANWDQDDNSLTYDVIREDKGATPIYTTDAVSQFWNRPSMGYRDTSVTPGKTYRYRVTAADPSGNKVTSNWISVTTPTADAESAYAAKIVDDGASTFWRLGETSGTTAIDWAGFNDGTVGAGVTGGSTGAITGDANKASTFNGSGTASIASRSAAPAPNTFTVEAWIKTTTTQGGKIIGYGDQAASNSGNYDRHVYMDNAGKIWFGVHPGGVRTLNSANSYNDGQYHHVVASMGANGMKLYVDDKLVGQRSDVTFGQDFTGYWKVGGDNLGGWSNQPSSNYFNGDIDDVAIYPTVLSPAKIDQHWVASGRVSTIPAAPADAYGKAVFNDGPSLFYRFNDTGNAAADSGPAESPGTYYGGVTKPAPGIVSGGGGTAATFDGNYALVSTDASFANPTVYSMELWFKTTTTAGGKLIGFGSNKTDTSGSYDRHVYMSNDGRLTFGAYTGQLNTATSDQPYNDGQWHQVVATQGSDGMKLYVDGAVVATNAQTGAQPYDGYWRIGGDNHWGCCSPFLAGTIDDASVYATVLSPERVATHYSLGANIAPPNQLPTAAYTSTVTDLKVDVDGSTSSDPDGTIASYAWDFGDDATANTATASHTYATGGTYDVKLTVTDNSGGAKSITKQVTVVAPNVAPTAAFTQQCTAGACAFDASTSTDSDGTIESYAWTFGDTTSGTGKTPSHTYASTGTYAVTLTVTDDDGDTKSVTKAVSVTVPIPNKPPTASFTSSTAGLNANFNASASTDLDGTIVSYAWNFGDSTTGVDEIATHTYTAPGTYSVTLTVTDNEGAIDTILNDVTVGAQPNQAPVAAFTAGSNGLTGSFNAGSSTDSDGTIASYAWTYGDGTSGTGATSTKAYAGSGSYTVTLTVTDNDGATGTVSKLVRVNTGTVVGADTFTRTGNGLWGSADTGGAWTLSVPAAFSTNGTAGKINLAAPSTAPFAQLKSAVATDVNITAETSISATPNGSGASFILMSRKTASSDYRFKLRYLATGKFNLVLTKVVGGVETSIREIAVPTLTYAPGDVFKVRFVVSGTGTTTLSGKVWKSGTAEPATAQITSTDTTASLQAPGWVAVHGYLSGNVTNAPAVLTVDNYLVTTG